jgi:N-acetylmuramoyl-L-alanine amidase
MISIHADAFTDTRAYGASVFAISNKGATSAMAAFIAKQENDADVIGGVNLANKDDVLAEVLTDLSFTASQEASLKVGKSVLRNMGRLGKLHSHRVEQAGFAVLKAPDLPAILVETGFISNPSEASRLADRTHQRKVASAIFSGINNYFSDYPPPDTYLAWRKDSRRSPLLAKND